MALRVERDDVVFPELLMVWEVSKANREQTNPFGLRAVETHTGHTDGFSVLS